MADIKLIIAAHKKCDVPSDEIYLPVQVGAKGKESIGENFKRDDEGENISEKNPGFCELTGLYWAWKNLESDYVGLVHYRRYLTIFRHPSRVMEEAVLTKKQAETFIKKKQADIIVPKKRRYYIESLYSHYAHTHVAKPLDMAIDIVNERYGEYSESLKKVINKTGGYMFNMFLMRRDLFDKYMDFLFGVLFELEERIEKEQPDELKNMTGFDARFYGRISEIFFNVWLYKECKDNPEIKVCETGLYFTEPEPILKKIVFFLKAKFTGKKYERSF